MGAEQSLKLMPAKVAADRSHAGVQLLGALVILQLLSIPQIVENREMHRGAALALLGYEAFLLVLLGFQIQRARKRICWPDKWAKPRLWTETNCAVLFMLGLSAVASRLSGWLAWPLLLGATAIPISSLVLYRYNFRAWKEASSTS